MQKASGNKELSEIEAQLGEVAFATFSTFSNDRIASRIMLFAADAGLERVFLLTDAQTTKIGQLEKNARATLCVLSQKEPLEESSEIIVTGSVERWTEFDAPTVQAGLSALAEKSPNIAALKQSGSLGNYCLLELKPEEIRHTTYLDAVSGKPPTIYQG